MIKETELAGKIKDKYCTPVEVEEKDDSKVVSESGFAAEVLHCSVWFRLSFLISISNGLEKYWRMRFHSDTRFQWVIFSRYNFLLLFLIFTVSPFSIL